MNFPISFLAALLMLSLSAPLEHPSEQEQLGLEILLTMSVVMGDCANVRLDMGRIESVISGYGIKQADVIGKYRNFSVAYASDLIKAADADPVKFCIYAIETFGPEGIIPGLIVNQ